MLGVSVEDGMSSRTAKRDPPPCIVGRMAWDGLDGQGPDPKFTPLFGTSKSWLVQSPAGLMCRARVV